MARRPTQRRTPDLSGRETAFERAVNRTVFAETSGRFLVRASSPSFWGVRCRVQFRDGIGRTDNPTTALELEGMGFTVVDTAHNPGGGGGGGESGNTCANGDGGPETAR